MKWQHVSLAKYEVKTNVKMKKVETRLFKNVQEIVKWQHYYPRRLEVFLASFSEHNQQNQILLFAEHSL